MKAPQDRLSTHSMQGVCMQENPAHHPLRNMAAAAAQLLTLASMHEVNLQGTLLTASGSPKHGKNGKPTAILQPALPGSRCRFRIVAKHAAEKGKGNPEEMRVGLVSTGVYMARATVHPGQSWFSKSYPNTGSFFLLTKRSHCDLRRGSTADGARQTIAVGQGDVITVELGPPTAGTAPGAAPGAAAAGGGAQHQAQQVHTARFWLSERCAEAPFSAQHQRDGYLELTGVPASGDLHFAVQFHNCGDAVAIEPEWGVVRRGTADGVTKTMLRKVATSERSNAAWVDSRTTVPDGETVTVVRREAGGFVWVRTAAGVEGFIKAAYLHAPELGVVRRGTADGVTKTMLRKVATSERSNAAWVDSRTTVPDGETVTVVRREAGGFVWVRTAAGVEGFIKAAYLHAEEGVPAAAAAGKMRMYHGTDGANAASIIQNGLRASPKGRLGAGVYFTPDKDVASTIAKHRGLQFVVECEVTISKIYDFDAGAPPDLAHGSKDWAAHGCGRLTCI
eukprot:COSAG01_NODE_7899_length_3000_cov_12.889004_2_plen_506_part_00